MQEIIRIEIQGTSGDCPIAEAYRDRLAIELTRIRYQYSPLQPSAENSPQEWSYQTTSEVFRKRFRRIEKALPDALNIQTEQVYTNIGGIEFYITYADDTTERHFFYIPADEFSGLFRLIRLLIPGCEQLPAVIMTERNRRKLKKDGSGSESAMS